MNKCCGECKQLFALCLGLGLYVTEVYEIEARWNGLQPLSLKVVNYRFIINCIV